MATSAMLAAALLMPTTGVAAPKFTRIATVNGATSQAVAITRTADGTLHLVYQTYSGATITGLGAIAISTSGHVGPQVQALSGWTPGQPGLVALPGGTLEAVFGAISPTGQSSLWGIASGDGGATWGAPTDVKAGGPNEALVYASDVTAAMAGSTPVLALPQAGNLVIQQGFGPGSPNYQVTNSSDGSAGDANLATDASSGQVVAAWQSIAGNPTEYLQGVAPTVGSAQSVPGQSRPALVIAARDIGPGVFGAYTTDGTHVRLQRYGGGSVAVGSLHGVTAQALGVATGLGGRIWVMWGTDSIPGGIAVTRSNKAVTRFEPIQHLNPHSGSLYEISGDGRLGPLDLLVDQVPNSSPIQPPGSYYARVFPTLSASVAVKRVKKAGKVLAFKLTVHVTDAGDAVGGAKASAKGKHATTNGAGVAKLTLPGSSQGVVKITVSDPGYQLLSKKIRL
jgi:hypothetical protein